VKKNRLNLIVEEVTTKYNLRSEEEYKKTAKIISEITNKVPGNSLVFFPSYALLDKVNNYFSSYSAKEFILERPRLSKEEKQKVLDKFRSGKDEGCVLLGVAAGSFGEGIDLPGEELKCVIVVGVPLGKPDLETRDLIEYYQDKYGEGMNYGYIYPAITKTMQNAGRCIRSEKDRGVVVFMDVRYTWENYFKCFPEHWNMNITKMWEERISKFFNN